MIEWIKKFVYWNWTIHRLPLDERLDVVKQIATVKEMSGPANFLYATVAIELGWVDVAKVYYGRWLDEWVKDVML